VGGGATLYLIVTPHLLLIVTMKAITSLIALLLPAVHRAFTSPLP
jgi:hypothetical protein